jgi:hypothetical protein
MGADAFDALNERMFKKLLDLKPEVGTVMGLHDPYDMMMPHGGVEDLTEAYALLREWRTEAGELVSKQPFSIDQSLSLRILDASIEMLRFAIEEHQMYRMYPNAADGIGSLAFIMFSREYAPVEFRARCLATRLRLVPKYLGEFETRFADGRPVKLWTEEAIESCGQVPGFLSFIESAWKDRVSPGTALELSEGVRTATGALAAHRSWLQELLKTARPDFAMGPEMFEKLLKVRGLGMTGDEILRLGERYLRDLKAEREVVAARISGGKGLEEAKRIVEEDSPNTFEEGLEATKAEMESAKRFIVDNDLATVDEKGVLKVIETPDFLRPLFPYAALMMSSKFDPVQEGAYIVTRPKDPKDLAKHLNHASIINTAVHEAFPGHFHQGVCSNQRHWMLQLHQMVSGNDTISTSAETVEGWAHYCEKMMFDHGYKATDAAELEMLNGAIWRAYRIIADIKLARGEATVEEMIQFGMEEGGMPRDAAEAEVRRYTHTPGQALSYLVGRHMIIEFRKDMERELGQRFDEKRFHDLIAGYGFLPMSLMKEAVRAGMKQG